MRATLILVKSLLSCFLLAAMSYFASHAVGEISSHREVAVEAPVGFTYKDYACSASLSLIWERNYSVV